MAYPLLEGLKSQSVEENSLYQYMLIGDEIGLGWNQEHFRNETLQDLIDELKHRRYNAGALPGELQRALDDKFFSRRLHYRISKWANYDGQGEHVARALCRAWFRKRNEPDNVPRRFLDQRDRPIGPVAADYRAWADAVIINWGGTPPTDPRIIAALS